MNDEDRLLRPERLAQVADYLDEAVEKIRAWGVRVADNSRLQKMSRLLRDTTMRGSFLENEGELSILSEAIRNAQEFIEIANVLPDEPFPSLQQDLRAAVAGDLRPVESSTGPHLQFQTQLWVGAMLAQTGGQVGVLMRPGGEKNPDFILSNGTLKYAVEVKRPNGELDAQNIIRKAARQIRSERFHGGMIVVDLTDCVNPAIRHRCGEGHPDLSELHDVVDELLRSLHHEVFEDGPERLRARREHVFGLIGFARAAYWNLNDLSFPYLNRYVGTISYWRRDHRTLRAHRARWLGELIHQGISAVGHQSTGEGAIPVSTRPREAPGAAPPD